MGPKLSIRQVKPSINKETPSLKDKLMEQIRRKVKVDERGYVYPITQTFYLNGQVWRPHSDYTKKKALSHIQRLSSPRLDPIVTPFGKKVPWVEIIRTASQFVKMIDDPNLRNWELRELQDYGNSNFSRHSYTPLMYLARQAGYSREIYQYGTDISYTIEVPKFQPLKRLREVELSADSSKANVGFPWLTRMSESGQEYRTSPVYMEVIEAASKWKTQILQLPKLTTAIVTGMSPYIMVFERAQSRGRPVQALSKMVALPQLLFTQPLTEACEVGVREFAGGDRDALMDKCRMLIDGTILELGKGDDLAVRLRDGTVVGADASMMDALNRKEENLLHVNAVAEHLNSEDEKIWRATCMAENTDMVNCVGEVVKEPFHGTVSGSSRTANLNTGITLGRAKSCKRDSSSSVLSQLNKFGPYRLEFSGKGFVIILKLYYSDRNPDAIHGSIVRMCGAAGQREDPVLAKRKSEFMLDEEARLLMLCGSLYGHPMFEEYCKWIRNNWEFRIPFEKISERAEEKMDKRREVKLTKSGRYEREGLAAARDLVY